MKKTRKKSQNLVTEEYLDRRLDKVMKYINFQLEEIREFRKEFSSFKEMISKTLDWLVGSYKRLDEDHIAESEQHERINKKVNNHESRIQVLEKKSAYS